MKKLMIATVAVAAACAANAMSVEWGFGGKVYLAEDNAKGSSAATFSNYTGTPMGTDAALQLYYLGQNVSTVDIADLNKYTLIDSIAFDVGTAAPFKDKFTTATKVKDVGSTYADNASFAVLFYNGTDVDYVYSVNTTDKKISDALVAATTYADMSGKTSYNPLYATGGGTTAGGLIASAVPEPTSGLLLLLGVAGLALRRRRA